MNCQNEATDGERSERLQEARRNWLALDPKDDTVARSQQMQVIQDVFQAIYKDKEASDEDRSIAGERLALLWIQKGDDESIRHADAVLRDLGYTCRLSGYILGYQLASNAILQSTVSRRTSTSSMIPFAAFDTFLSESERQGLNQIFLRPEAPYWTTHNYQVEPPSPYYSYVLPLSSPLLSPMTLLGSIIHKIRNQVAVFQPASAKQAQYMELWAHNRPIVTGHQLHFDSDNEGADATIRHPLTTSIVYLTGHGGPTLISNQRLVSRQAADKGWLLPAKANRVVHMDGRVLHCVVPGNSFQESINMAGEQRGVRRVSVMIALWRSIRIRDEAIPGAARPFPTEAIWTKELMAPISPTESGDCHGSASCTPVECLPLKHVFERVEDGLPWTRDDGMPEYDQIFQGL